MMRPFSGRQGKTARAYGRGCACTEKHGESDVYGEEHNDPLAAGLLSDGVKALPFSATPAKPEEIGKKKEPK